MSCCHGNRPQRVKRQVIEAVKQDAEETPTIQRRVGRQSTQPVDIQRQYLVPRQQCSKCGYPMMTVTIAGRERQQCSNANCRIVV